MTKTMMGIDKMKAQALTDIEESGVPRLCFACRRPQKKATLVVDGTRYKNYIGVCENKKCFRYIDVGNLRTWQVD